MQILAAAQDDSLGGLAQTPGFWGVCASPLSADRESQVHGSLDSPRSGRKIVAHGASRGYGSIPLTPAPLPAARGEGCRGRGEGSFPTARALGYGLAPLTGLAPAPHFRGSQAGADPWFLGSAISRRDHLAARNSREYILRQYAV